MPSIPFAQKHEFSEHCCSMPNSSQTSELPQMKQPSLTHVSLLAHMQSIVPPQPSENVPHCWAGHVPGVQQLPRLQTCPAAQGAPHDPQFCGSVCRSTHMLPQQVCPVGQSPQSGLPPQPSEMTPQRPAHVAGVQQFPWKQTTGGTQLFVQLPQLLGSFRFVH